MRVMAGQRGTDADAARGKKRRTRRGLSGGKGGGEGGRDGQAPTARIRVAPALNVSVSVSAVARASGSARYHPGSYEPHLSRHTSSPLSPRAPSRPSPVVVALALVAGPSPRSRARQHRRRRCSARRFSRRAKVETSGGSLASVGGVKKKIAQRTRCTMSGTVYPFGIRGGHAKERVERPRSQ